MKGIERVWLAGPLLAVLLLGLPMLNPQEARADVLIAEVLADPATDWDGDGEVDYKDDEWIEVVNTGPLTVDLAEYWLRDGLGETPHLNLSGTLVPGAVAVFYGSDALLWQQENDAGSSGFSLNNGGDTVELLITLSGPDDLQVVDAYVYAAHEAEDDRASGRLPGTLDWALFDGLNPYDGETEALGTGCLPTPASANDCVPDVAAQRSTWSVLKINYR